MNETVWICRNCNGDLCLSVKDPGSINHEGKFDLCGSLFMSGHGGVSSLPNNLLWGLKPGEKREFQLMEAIKAVAVCTRG